jgi:hypothetical protein
VNEPDKSGVILIAGGSKPHREPDLFGLVNDFAPQIDRFVVRQIDFQPNQLRGPYLPTRKDKTSSHAQIRDCGGAAFQHTFPASRKTYIYS